MMSWRPEGSPCAWAPGRKPSISTSISHSIGQGRAGRERKPFPGPHSLDRRKPAASREEGISSRGPGDDEVKTAGMNRPHGMI